MEMIHPVISDYCDLHTDEEPKILAEINRETHVNMLKPRMLSGHYQGRLLSVLSQMIRPKYILEIGTFTGYSAICLAEGLVKGGKVITIEINEEFEQKIRENIEKSGKTEQIELIIGNALEIIPTFNINFDLVFIDADKSNYLNYYKSIIDKVRSGGLIISDNVLWSGKVSDETKNDHTTKLLREFNDFLTKDKRTKKVLLPVRDGMFLSIKN